MKKNSVKKLVICLTLVWLAALLRLTVFRPGCFSHGLFSGRVEWDAFAFYLRLVQIRYWGYFAYLFGGNLIWFAPAGVLVRMRGGRFWQAVLAGFALSLCIETAQFVLGSGISELDDLIVNTCGAVLGYWITGVITKFCEKNNFPIDKNPHHIDNRQ